MAHAADVPNLKLNNGVLVPQFGLGTWPMDDSEAEQTVSAALQMGYRLVDTAAAYGNERGVGKGMKASGLPREEVFVTTKLMGRDHGYDSALRAFDKSAERLGVDYIDLYLIHWPLPGQNLFTEAWRAFVKLHEDGRAKAIGVSNFKPDHIDRCIAETGVTPMVNQIQLHPAITQPEQRAYDDQHGIVTESWSPLGQGANVTVFGRPGDVLHNEVVAGLADKHDKTPAQIVLRWHLELGLVPIPKTSNPQRLRENLDVFDFQLDAGDMKQMAQLGEGEDPVDSDVHTEY